MANETDQRAKAKCNCKKSKCLKLYCECFSRHQYCGEDCECDCCANKEANEKRLLALRSDVWGKRANDEKGCRCQKSNCQKKYCDCYNKGSMCGKHCSCYNC